MNGICDVHCHILPGVDDGAKTMELSLEMLRKEYQDGVRSILLTPHFRREMFEPSMDEIYEAFDALTFAVRRTRLRLYLGCEYHVNMEMCEDLLLGRRPTLAGSPYVLCEFSSGDSASYIKERCYQLASRGFIPVLAHIERYQALTKDFDLISELIEFGCRMQVNAGSILGKDGFNAKRFCKKLIREDMLHYIGSDAHDMKSRPPLLGECAEYLEKKCGYDYTQKVMRDNPLAILQ